MKTAEYNSILWHVKKAYLGWSQPSLLMRVLRILAMYEAKTAENSNFWMFWSRILLICHLFKNFITRASLKDALVFKLLGKVYQGGLIFAS